MIYSWLNLLLSTIREKKELMLLFDKDQSWKSHETYDENVVYWLFSSFEREEEKLSNLDTEWERAEREALAPWNIHEDMMLTMTWILRFSSSFRKYRRSFLSVFVLLLCSRSKWNQSSFLIRNHNWSWMMIIRWMRKCKRWTRIQL